MKKLTLLLLLVAPSITPNFAAPNEWESGFYQGIIGYIIDNDQTQMAIGCNWGNDDHLEHSVIIISNGEEAPLKNEDGEIATIEFVINGQDYTFPRESHSAAGAAAWREFSQALASAYSFELFWDGEYIASFNPTNLNVISDLVSCAPMRDREKDLEIDDYMGDTINLNKQMDQPSMASDNHPISDITIPSEQMISKQAATQQNSAPKQAGNLTAPPTTLSYKIPYYSRELEIPTNGFGIDYQTQFMTNIAEITYLTLISGYQQAITIDALTLNQDQCPLLRSEKGRIAHAEHLPEKIKALYGNEPLFPITLQPGESTYFIFSTCPNPEEITITTDQGIQVIKLY